MLEVRFTVIGEPVSKERARVTSKGAYTPKRTVEAEKSVRAAYRAAQHPSMTSEPHLSGNIEAEMVFYLGTKRRRDLDNMAKLVLDALNKVAYEDDVQVHSKMSSKCYTTKERARTEVVLRETDNTFQERQ